MNFCSLCVAFKAFITRLATWIAACRRVFQVISTRGLQNWKFFLNSTQNSTDAFCFKHSTPSCKSHNSVKPEETSHMCCWNCHSLHFQIITVSSVSVMDKLTKPTRSISILFLHNNHRIYFVVQG